MTVAPLKGFGKEREKSGWYPKEMRNPDELADFVQARMKELNISAHDVARLSGNRISVGTVWNLLNRRIRNIATESLEAFAKALQVSADELFDIAYGRRRRDEDPNELKLVIYYRNVPPETQKDMMAMMGTLHRDHAIAPVEKIERVATKRKRVA